MTQIPCCAGCNQRLSREGHGWFCRVMACENYGMQIGRPLWRKKP